MDKLACSMMFQTIFLMILYGDISSQPLYENNREDQVTTKHTEFYYQKLYEREIFLENQVNNFKKELDICTDSTTSMEKLTTPNPMSDSTTSMEKLTASNPMSGQNKTLGSRGRRFIILFMQHSGYPTKNVYITSEKSVQIRFTTSPRLEGSLMTQVDRNVTFLSSLRIILPQGLELKSFQKEVKSVLIEASEDVSVISHDDKENSAGSTKNIPLHKLSTKYLVISTEPIYFKSEFAVSAIEDKTAVTVTLKMKRNLTLNIEGNTYYNGDVFHLTLDAFETYQIEHTSDLTGTLIESSVPIAAFSGNDCNKLDYIGGCDYFFEQLPPTDSVDSTYIVPPNSNARDTIIRITAVENANIVYMIGTVTQTRYMYKSESFDTKISSSQICFIESKAPILVTAFGLTSKNSSLGDPSMTIVPGLNQYLDYYKIIVPAGYQHSYRYIMMKNSSKDSFRINNTALNMDDVVFEGNASAGNVMYNVRSLRVREGELTATTVNGERFGLMFAGVAYSEAYGFSGNSVFP
nr:uncharacterized protein LOC105332273 isoform X2 [Crassostrea gigas]